MARGFALSFAVLLAVFEIGTCLKCIQCNKQSNPDCDEKITSAEKYAVDCSNQIPSNYNRLYLNTVLPPELTSTGPNQFCVKVTTQTGTTARTCMPGSTLTEMNQACTNAINNKILKTCKFCDKDVCNSSSAITSSLPVAFLALIATYLFYKQ